MGGHLFLAGSSEAAVDEVHAWTYGKVVATRAALGFQRVDKNTTAPYNIEVQKVAADATEQAPPAGVHDACGEADGGRRARLMACQGSSNGGCPTNGAEHAPCLV